VAPVVVQLNPVVMFLASAFCSRIIFLLKTSDLAKAAYFPRKNAINNLFYTLLITNSLGKFEKSFLNFVRNRETQYFPTQIKVMKKGAVILGLGQIERFVW